MARFGAFPGSSCEAYPGALVAYPAAYLGASLADEACEEMHGKMATSCLILGEPFHNPHYFRTVVEAECRRCTRDEETHDEASHGEGNRDGTWVVGQEGRRYLGQMIASLG